MEEIDPVVEAARAAAAAFTNAALAKDEAAAKAACTEDGWSQGEDPARGLFYAVTKKGLVADRMGPPTKFGSRATQLCVLSHPKAPKPLGDLFLLLEDVDGQWKVVGATKHRPVVGLFLWGHIPGHLSWRDLDADPAAEAWAAGTGAALEAGISLDPTPGHDLLGQRVAVDDVAVTRLENVGLPEAKRAAVGWRFTTPEDAVGYDVWIILDTSTTPPEALRSVEFMSLAELLRDLDLDWPHEDPEQPGRALTAEERPTDPRGAAAVLEGLLRRTLDKEGVDLDGEGERAAQARELLGFIRKMIPKGQEPLPEGAAARQVVLPPGFDKALQKSVQGLVDQGVAGPGTLRIDKDFIQQHGGALVGGLFGALLADTLPPAVEITVPIENPEPGGPQVVTLQAEPQKLLQQLVAGPEVDDA
jgi:hypothetical protein